MEEKTRRAKRQFTDEFKNEAIELAKKVGNSQAARDLGLYETQIRQWKAKSGASAGSAGPKSYADLERENKQLSKELSYLKEINKVLKKSTAIFSVDQLENFK